MTFIHRGVEYVKFFVWKSIHRLPRAAIEWWQANRLRGIIRHAQERVPLYQAIWTECNRPVADMDFPKDMEKLPLVTRSIFQEHSESNSTSPGLPPLFYAVRGRTSGSTGTPFHFICPTYGDGDPVVERWYFFHKRWRFLAWRGVSLSKARDSMRVLKFKMRRLSSDPLSLFVDPEHLVSKPQQVIQEIKEFEPDAIVCYTSALVEFCSILERCGFAGAVPIRFAVSSGEMLTDTQRSLITRVLDCEVYNRYGLEEFYRTVGVECKEHNGFHLNAESFFLEVTDDDGKRVMRGNTGRLVITDLYNRAMPFIRYDTGDIGNIIPESCPCGIAAPRFIVEGRTLSLTFKDRELNYVDINRFITRRPGAILQWQANKTGAQTLELLIVRGPSFTQELETMILSSLFDVLPDVEVSLKYANQISQDPGQKIRLFVDSTLESDA